MPLLYILVENNASLIQLISIFIVESILFSAIATLFLHKNFINISKVKFEAGEAKRLFSMSWLLIISGVFAQAYLRIDQLMIKHFLGEVDVANYSSVVIIEPFSFISTVVMSSLFPIILNKSRESNVKKIKVFEFCQNDMTLLSLLLVAGIYFLAPYVLNFLYDNKYNNVLSIMQLHAFSIIFLFWGQVYFKWVFVEEAYGFTVVSHGLGAIINIVLNLFFIERFGIIGATYSTIIAYSSAFSFSLLLYKKTRDLFYIQIKSLIKLPFVLKGYKDE